MTSPARQRLADTYCNPTDTLLALASLGVSDATVERVTANFPHYTALMVEWAAEACIIEFRLKPQAAQLLREIPPIHSDYDECSAPFLATIAQMLAGLDPAALDQVRILLAQRWRERETSWLRDYDEYMMALTCIVLTEYSAAIVEVFRPVWAAIPRKTLRFIQELDVWRNTGKPAPVAVTIRALLDLGVLGLRVALFWLSCDEGGGPTNLVGHLQLVLRGLADDPALVEYALALVGEHPDGCFDESFPPLLQAAAMLQEPMPAEMH